MKIIGIIAEYNPFHNGHQYHIERAKEITGADAVIVVMSGNFVQRGTPAIMPKHLRAKAALEAGASLVLELPVCYATGSAEYFAHGAILLLEQLGCVDSVCFGSECGDISKLQEIARLLSEEPASYKDRLQDFLRQGEAFPLARQRAVKEYLQSDDFDSILSEPNNILGLEYLKALYRTGSKINPYTIQRVSSHYHDSMLQETLSSASAIRNVISSGDFSPLKGQVPKSAASMMEQCFHSRFPVYADDFSLLLKYRLMNETTESLAQYADVSEELANRILNQLNQFIHFEQFCNLLKTKEVTYTRISRALLHILINIKTTDYTGIHYARMLGFRLSDASILSQIKRHAAIPLIAKLTNANELSDMARQMLATDIAASDLYESVVTDKFKTKFINEYKQQIVRI